MPVRRHVPLGVLVLCLALVGAYRGHSYGQTRAIAPRSVLLTGLPAIERGVVQDESHAPHTPEALKRDSIRLSSLTLDRTGISGAHYIAGRVIVKFRDNASTLSRLTVLARASASATISERPSYANFDLVLIDIDEDAESVARTLAAEADVEYAQAAYRVRPAFVPNDPLYKELQWNLPLIDLERAWDIQPAAGSSITVAVVDTGIAYTNATVRFRGFAFRDDRGTLYPALGDVTVPFAAAPQLASPGRFVAPYDFVWDDDLPLDLHGHGTHVSGTIGQLTDDSVGTAGVAFNVKLMPVKVICTEWDFIFGAPDPSCDSDLPVARGIRYAADNGAKVINLSVGRTGPPAPAIEDAIRYAVCPGAPSSTCSGKGVFIAIAGGNSFEQGNPTEVLAEIASRVHGAVSVTAVDPQKRHAHYASTGSWIELAAPGGTDQGFGNQGFVWQQTYHPDFTETFLSPPSRYGAPRFDVLAYVGYAGTSQAAPHVSGVAAMLVQQGITDPAAVEAALERFATDLGDPGRDPTFGFGLINARNTLRGLGLAR